MARRPLLVPIALSLGLFAAPAGADDPPPLPADSTEDPAVVEARADFIRGTQLVKEAQWAEALAAFERSAKRRPHPVTTYNVGICQRAMGQYTQARLTLQRALAENDAGGKPMSEGVVKEIQELIGEIERILARLTITLKPETAAISIDGRPLEPEPRGTGATRPVLLAGVRPPGPGAAAPATTFDVLLAPGAHVITLSRKGFADAVVNKTVAPGSTGELPIELSRLPAVIHVSATQPGAVVTIDDFDVGVAPVDVQRPAGSYRVVVRKKGHVTYATRVTLQSGERTSLSASLPVEKPALYERWWFWAGAGAVVTGAVLGTYFATRPEPTRPPVDGGGLDWAKKLE